VKTLAWLACSCVGTIALFDISTSLLFSIPEGERLPRGKIAEYISYGESVERKLDRTVGAEGQEPTSLVRAGWIKTELYSPPKDWRAGGARVAFYGMSFLLQVAAALDEAYPAYAIMTRGGPSAPLSHSYALFENDKWGAEADVIILGVLSSSIPHLQALTCLGFTTESPAPYTFPKFELIGDRLSRTDPVIADRGEFIAAFRQRSDKWTAHLDSLRAHDGFWISLVFEKSPLDSSTFAKFLMRAWAKRVQQQRRDAVYSFEGGYVRDHPAIAAVPRLLGSVQETCVKNKQRLVVVLLHARGEPGHLDRWLRADLEQRGISVISTIDHFDSMDYLNFLPDSHYLPRLDQELAEALNTLLTK